VPKIKGWKQIGRRKWRSKITGEIILIKRNPKTKLWVVISKIEGRPKILTGEKKVIRALDFAVEYMRKGGV